MGDQIEQEIRDLIASEPQAVVLSERLFSPNGLFSQLAATETERRAILQSPLFKQAQRRLTAMQQKEAADFSRAVHQAKTSMPENGCLVKIERVKVP